MPKYLSSIIGIILILLIYFHYYNKDDKYLSCTTSQVVLNKLLNETMIAEYLPGGDITGQSSEQDKTMFGG
jgi:hypothetical protein